MILIVGEWGIFGREVYESLFFLITKHLFGLYHILVINYSLLNQQIGVNIFKKNSDYILT